MAGGSKLVSIIKCKDLVFVRETQPHGSGIVAILQLDKNFENMCAAFMHMS